MAPQPVKKAATPVKPTTTSTAPAKAPVKAVPARVIPDRVDSGKVTAPKVTAPKVTTLPASRVVSTVTAKPTGSADTQEAKLKAAAKPAKPSTPAGTGMHWEYNSKTNKWVKTKNKVAAGPSAGGQGFEFGGLPTLDFSNIDFSGITLPGAEPAATAAPAAPAGPSEEELQAQRMAEADRLARSGASASAVGAAAGLSRDELAKIFEDEQTAGMTLAESLAEIAGNRRAAVNETRAAQNAAAYQNALARQASQAQMAAQGFGGAGVGTYQRRVLERQGMQALSEQEARRAAALAAYDAMEQQARARRDAVQRTLLARINPVANFVQGVS